jgi:GNAT superfamily N-acetyltransferase
MDWRMTKTDGPQAVVIAEEAEPDRETVAALHRGLGAYNAAMHGPDASAPLWFIARDVAGQVRAGLRGQTLWSWCFVNLLWVAEPHRRNGLGSQLLKGAESSARTRGCVGIYLDTFSFQAPDFYKRHGYTEFGRLDGFPAGHARIWMMKML